MASAQFNGKGYPVFVYDPRHPINGHMFGILGRFVGLMIFHADQYLDHLDCDVLAYRSCGSKTEFSTTDKLELPDRIPRLVWKCNCGNFRFCHIWIKKVDYNEEEKMKIISMLPVLENFLSEDLQEQLFDINIHFIVKSFMIYIWTFFICHIFNPVDQSLFAGLANGIDVLIIE